MNLQGLDYNTQRPRLVLPEYGREVQQMVEACKTIADRDKRLQYAKQITSVMLSRVPSLRQNQNYQQTLWDHLYLLGKGSLDIDWPMDPKGAKQLETKPEPIPLNKEGVRMRHYGRLVGELCDRLKQMEEGPERDELARLTANQMRRMLLDWGHGSTEAERIMGDLADMTDGKIQLNAKQFKFDEYRPLPPQQGGKKRKKR